MFDELRRRNVHRAAVAYLAGSWLLVQVIETFTPDFLPAVVFRTAVILLAIGFFPALILAWKFEWTPEGIRREEALPADSERPRSRAFDRIVTVVLVAAVAYFAVDKFVLDPARDQAEIRAATEEAAKRALSGNFLDEFRDRSILVIPFLNMSPEPDQEFFADGISEEILNVLARIEELRVISRSTSWTFKGQDVDVDAVQRDLDLSHILEGSVRKAGDRLRITAQLIDARTDTHLWSETWDRRLEDVLAIQDEIAVAVAEQLHLEILGAESPHEGVDPRAYELYLRADARPEALIQDEAAGRLVTAKHLLEEALAIEPNYLPALWGLAVASEFLRQQADPGESAARKKDIIGLVNRMEALAPDSVFVSNWRAYMAMRWENDLATAAPHLENSMRYANRTDVHIWFNGAIDLLLALGRNAEAMTVAQYWVNRDPYCILCLRKLAIAANAADRHVEAALVLDRLVARSSGDVQYWNAGVAYLAAGLPEKALQLFDQIDDSSEQITKDFARAFALYSLGRVEEFDSYLERSVSNYSENSAESIARLYAWSNRRDEAFEWLEKMVKDQGPDSAKTVKTELYEPIKSDPRWQAFLEKHGAEDRRYTNVRFQPQYPPALQRAVDELSAR